MERLSFGLKLDQEPAVFIGPDGLGAWENEELRSALDIRVRGKTLRIIPVLLPGANVEDETAFPTFLRRFSWVDFRAGMDDPKAFQRVVAGIRMQLPENLAE